MNGTYFFKKLLIECDLLFSISLSFKKSISEFEIILLELFLLSLILIVIKIFSPLNDS